MGLYHDVGLYDYFALDWNFAYEIILNNLLIDSKRLIFKIQKCLYSGYNLTSCAVEKNKMIKISAE